MFNQSYRYLHWKFENQIKEIRKNFRVSDITIYHECQLLSDLKVVKHVLSFACVKIGVFQDENSEISKFYRQNKVLKSEGKIGRLIPRHSLRGGNCEVYNMLCSIPPEAKEGLYYLDVNRYDKIQNNTSR